MKTKLREIIADAAEKAYQDGLLSSPALPEVEIEVPRITDHGDFSTNIAMASAAVQKRPPRKIAEAILSRIRDPEQIIDNTEIAGPGFINFFITPAAWQSQLHDIDRADTAYGACNLGGGQKIQIEFVSANPTGPLHVGHGRGAAVGDSLARLLAFCGWQVEREYYINDAGNQIMTLGRSVFLRWREILGDAVVFPQDCYQGDYIRQIARKIDEAFGDQLAARYETGETAVIEFCAGQAVAEILGGIRDDLAHFGIVIDNWFSEKSLVTENAVGDALALMKDGGLAYEFEGALWFQSSSFGDEKDRVMVRNNGETTYFASDIAYHKNKFERGFERVVDIWGADHHGYVPRMKAAVQALGRDSEALNIILVQLVNLLRDGRPVSMSTRSGEFVTLREVVDEVGADAARFIFLSRHYDSPLDFDLALAKKQNNDNPVYYVQYVHARITSIMRKAKTDYHIEAVTANEQAVSRLVEPEEIELIKTAVRYPDVVKTAAQAMEPHRITFYLLELAAAFHSYYNRHKVLTDDADLSQGRLFLVQCLKKVIRNGLTLLGVTAPESM
jgi:arginyl-tRNA synthetase